jgi:5'-nucleotidase
MKILATNDDGIKADSLWALVEELKKVAQVTVIAPDRERSAIGTAVSLFGDLHIHEIDAPAPGVIAYAVDGTPSDCVILGLGKLVEDVDMVVSGVNPNLNLGEDVYISGTVGAAMQGYFRGLPALAVSAPPDSRPGLETAARAAAFLAPRMVEESLRVFLNLNTPDLPAAGVRGVKITRLARASHINSVTQYEREGNEVYHLVRERLDKDGREGTDIQAIMSGYISLTPLYTSLLDKPPQRFLKKLAAELAHELKLKQEL